MKANTFLVFLLILLATNYINAQSGQATNPAGDYNPNSTPPSPEAFNFTKVGELPVNESTGNAIVNIPLYTFEVGKISVPISISHGGGAVKVDEDNSWTGINWQLSAGGLITRTVNDRPDEKMGQGERLHPTGNVSQQTFHTIAISSKDSEVDIFNYNFNGYSGSFYFDTLFVARHIKYDHELKIEMSISGSNKSTIIITDMEGTQYHFGGLDASESTKLRTGPLDMNEEFQTSFYLFKIENITGDIVNFIYDTEGWATLRTIGIQQELVQDIAIDGLSECSPQLNNNSFLSNPKRTYMQSSGRKLLRTITSNRNGFHKVVFNSSLNNSLSINRSILHDFQVYDYNNQEHKKVKFDYFYPENLSGTDYKRFFLSQVSFYYGNNTTTDEIYSLDYNNLDQLPERFSYSQDYAGYYNGKLNTNYIPFLPNMQNVFSLPEQTLADRSVDFEKTCHGSLKRITYPTKGFTQFDYETEPDGILGYVPGPERSLSVRYDKFGPTNQNQFTSTTHFLPSIDENNGSNPSSGGNTGNSILIPSPLNTSQPVKITVSVNITGPNTSHNFIRLTLDDVDSTNDVVRIEQLPSNSDSNTRYLTFNYTFTDLNILGNYHVTLDYYCTAEAGYPTTLNANAQISYSSHTPIPGFRPGIRVKRVLNYDSETSVPIVKRYYYNTAAKRNQSDSQIVVRQPRFFGNVIVTGACRINIPSFGGLACFPFRLYKTKIYSDTQNNIYISNYNRDLYQYVTVSYGGDNFENGGKQSKYYILADIPMSSITYNDNYVSDSKSSNNSLKNGTLLNEVYFNAEATFDVVTDEIIIGKVKEVTYDYLMLPEKSTSITNYFATKIFERPECLGLFDDYLDNYYIGHYPIFSWWYTLETKTTKEFFSNGVVETIEKYSYDNEVKLAGLPSKTTLDLGAEIIETKYYYPPDNEMIGQPNRTQLLVNNIISSPLKTEVFKNGIKISEQKTIFGYDSSTGYKLLPKFIYAAKFPNTIPVTPYGNLEKKVTYKYDTNGNLIEYQLENGTPVSLIWGFNKLKVVAKLENISYNQIPSSLITNIENVTSSATSSEIDMLNALEALRLSSDINLQNSMITTFIYNKNLNIISITDPKGDVINYSYDNFKRLEFIKDKDNNIVSENKYNFKN